MCIHVDDLTAILKDPDGFFDTLTNTYGYKPKGIGPPKYYLGGDFFRDDDEP